MNIKPADIINSDFDESILPVSVRDLVVVIGLVDVLKLVEHYGGLGVWVPVKFNPESQLSLLLGPEATLKLVEYAGHTFLDIPKCDQALRTIRNQLIRKSEKSQCKLAAEWKLTVRQIRNIQNSAGNESDHQPRLF